MYHYKARVYSPTLGRFLQTDPIGYDDQINLYAYVANDPVNKVDPSGKQTIEYQMEAEVKSLRDAGMSEEQIQQRLRDGALLQLSVLGGEGAGYLIGKGLGWAIQTASRAAQAGRPASSAAQAGLLRQNLLRQAVVGARNELRAGGGKAIAGAGTKVALRDAPRLAAKYGGEAGDYAKVTSRVVGETKNGATVQVHAYRNIETGILYESKIKIQ